MTTKPQTVPDNWSVPSGALYVERDDGLRLCFDVSSVFPDLTFEQIDEQYPVDESSHLHLVVSCLDYDSPAGPTTELKALDHTKPMQKETVEGEYGRYLVQSNVEE